MARDRAHDPFLTAILDNIDDDLPRLVYADWLEERGDPRGEFIRVQCTLARMTESDPRWQDVKAREKALLGKYRETWIEPIRGLIRDEEFHRRFVEQGTGDAVQFLANADTLFRRTPLRHLRRV